MDNFYHETKKYRCLVEYGRFPSEDFYLSMCGVESCLPGKGFGPVVREGYHLHVVLSGKGYLNVADRHYEVWGGQMFIEKPGELTEYHADEKNPWAYCWMAFGGKSAPSLVEAAGFTSDINVLNCSIDPIQFYNLADSALTHPGLSMADGLRRYGYLSQYIALAIDSAAASDDKKVASYLLNRGSDAYIDYALNYIRNNYAAISVTDIAAYLGISRSHLTRLFRQKLDCTPSEYLMKTRMDQAARLIKDTDLSVQEVSDIVGYEDQLTFSKAFKKVFGLSPKYYRQQFKVESPAKD